MPDKSEQNYITNIQLMKTIGLYQLLNPNAPKLFGYNVSKLGSFIILVYVTLVTLICLLSIHYSLYDFSAVIKYVSILLPVSFLWVIIYFVNRNSDVLWEFISSTSIHFLSYSGHQRNILTEARVISRIVSNITKIVWMIAAFVWIMAPIIIQDSYINVKFKNKKHVWYRYNMINLLFPVTADFYNDNFYIFYFIETLALIFYDTFNLIFDCLIISICITITYQLKMIALSYKRLGYNYNNTDVKCKFSVI